MLLDRGRRLVLTDEALGSGKHHAALTVGGVEVGVAQGTSFDTKLITFDDKVVRVKFGLRGNVKRAELFAADAVRRTGIWFEPPTGTRAHRTWAFRENHPALYASRHVALKIAGTLIAILGIGALIRAFLEQFIPRFDFSWLPTIPWPVLPEWIKYLNPGYWLSRLLDFLFGWISLPDFDFPEIPGWVKLVAPIVFAVALAVAEYRRHQKRKSENHAPPHEPKNGESDEDG